MATNYTLEQVAAEQSKLLEKLRNMPVTDEAGAILDLLQIQVLMAHVIADIVIVKEKI